MALFNSLPGVVERVAQATGTTPRAVWFVAGLVLALAVGTVGRIAAQRLFPTPRSASLLASLKTWWALIAALLLVTALGRAGIVVGMAAISTLALRELLTVLPKEWVPRPVAVAAFLLVPLQYLWIWLDREPLFLWFTPVALLAALPAVRMASAPPAGFFASLGAVQLSVAVSIYGLSHAACLTTLRESSNPIGGALGWLLFLLVVTEANDMAQAFCGRAFGRRKATPHISPNKTWEGFLGGALTAVVLAAAVAPWITPLAEPPPSWRDLPLLGLPYVPALAAGMIIALGGIVGDLTMSSCKRDRGVKDLGTLLPGHGGVLDRFDSLTVAAPLFFHFVRILDY